MEASLRVRELNDAVRRSFEGVRVILSLGISALPENLKARVLSGVRKFRGFDSEHNRQHDFGTFALGDVRVQWRITCYDRHMQAGSEDLGDPKKTVRVLSIMLASEC